MTDDIRKYAEQMILKTGIRIVPGHHPDFESKHQVDEWIETFLEPLRDYCVQRNLSDMTTVGLNEYREKLDSLKRNKENVPLELLITKYQKPYMHLKEEIKCLTEKILYNVVSFDLFVECEGSEQIFGRVNQAIKESGLLAEISHAAYHKQDADRVFECVMHLRELVHQAA